MLSRTAASQLNEGAGMERVQELGRQVAAGTYHPDADRIAGRLLGLN
jgi:anti-sigma28 factor (negative regulator of flagellin synthesis)